MKKIVMGSLLALVLSVSLGQLPGVQSALHTASLTFGGFDFGKSALYEYGQKIGYEINRSVESITERSKNSRLTDAHVKAVMCIEQPDATMSGVNGEGRVEGLVQVIPSTFEWLVNGKVCRKVRGRTRCKRVRPLCGYIKDIPNITCSTHADLARDTRCSIEVGMCYFDRFLTKCRGNVRCAYNGYNTGSTRKRANNSRQFISLYYKFKNNASFQCNRAYKKTKSHNRQVWSGIVQGVQDAQNGHMYADIDIITDGGGSVESQVQDFWRSDAGRGLYNGQQYKNENNTYQDVRWYKKEKVRTSSFIPNDARGQTIIYYQ